MKGILGVRPVDDTMVVGQGKICHLTNRDIIVAFGRGQNFRTFFDRSDAKDRDLRLIDDRRAEQSAKNTGIRDREGPALDLVRVKLFVRARSARSLAVGRKLRKATACRRF